MAQTERELRGEAILALGNQIFRMDSQTYRVNSQSGNGDYLVVKDGNGWVCGCPDNTYRETVCKHIYAVLASLQIRTKAAETDLTFPTPFNGSCLNCGSKHVHKWGWRYSKKGDRRCQRFKCLDCHHKFTDSEQGFEQMRANPHAVTVALDLYFKGVSFRKIVSHLTMFERVNVSHVAVIKWVRKYVALMKSYTDALSPQLSGVWHADEMKVNVNGSWVYLWNLMDSDTRYMLAMHVAKGREAKDGEQAFRKAQANAHSNPGVVITDGLASYKPAFERTFQESGAIHLAGVGIRSPISNNRIERFHSTYRERMKVMRAFDNLKGCQIISNGEQVYQNFIRPHSSLDGHTPAEKAGIDLQLSGNKWKALIQRAVISPKIRANRNKLDTWF